MTTNNGKPKGRSIEIPKWLFAFLSLALALCLGAGTAYALFTSQSTPEVRVSGGRVEVTATIEAPILYSPTSIAPDGTIVDATNAATSDRFCNGGHASTDGKLLIVDDLTPGDRATFTVKMENHSTVAIKYQTTVEAVNTASSTLYDALIITVDGRRADAVTLSDWVSVPPGEALPRDEMTVSIELPPDAPDRYVGESVALSISVNAVQGNAVVRDGLELAADGTWEIYGSRGFRAFGDSVAAGSTYAGETVRLLVDLDLSGQAGWTPIGTPNAPFAGTFDGDRHTIAGLTADAVPAAPTSPRAGGAGAIGLFGYVSGDVTVHDLTLRDVTVSGDEGVAALVGRVASGGTLSLSRIGLAGKVTVTADRLAGGLVGDASGATVTAETLLVAVDPASCIVTRNAATAIDGEGKRLSDDVGGVCGAMGSGRLTDVSSNIAVTGRSHGVGGVVGRAAGHLTRVSSSAAVTVTEQCRAIWYKNTVPDGIAYGDVCFWQGNGTVVGLHAAIELDAVLSTGTLAIHTPEGTVSTNGLTFRTTAGTPVSDSRVGCSYRFNDNTVVIRE